jgi:hypothetical protein
MIYRDGSTIELKSLNLDSINGAKFLVDNWPFAKSGSLSYVRKLIERNPSSGVYINGKLVSGAAMNGSGMITMLYTLPDFRLKGYAQLCMNYCAESLLKENLIPVSACNMIEMMNILLILRNFFCSVVQLKCIIQHHFLYKRKLECKFHMKLHT